jgi:hypothetical protein
LVHDVDGRLRAIRSLLDAHGFSRIVIDKEQGFEDTPVVNVYAMRTSG